MNFVERDSDHCFFFSLNSIRKFSRLLRNALHMYKTRNLGYLPSLELFLNEFLTTLTDQAVGHLNLSDNAMKTTFVILALRNS